MSSDHFDIVATIPAGVPLPSEAPQDEAPTQFQLMLRALLADRFKLEVHTETRQLPMNELVFLKSGALGPAMTRSTLTSLKS